MRRPEAFALIAGILSACALSSCDDAPREVPLRELRLGHFANVTHAQAVLGVASGDFAATVAPVKLRTKVFNAGPGVIEAIFAREVDIAYVGPGPVLSAHNRSHGEGVRVIAGAAANGVLIVARKDAGIASLNDLAGKRIATPQAGNTQDISARRYVTSVLGQRNANNVVAISNAEQAGMMSRGQIDAAWAPEPWGSRLMIENGATLIARESDLWSENKFLITVVVTTPEFLTRHPEVVRKVLNVHASWTQRLSNNPQAYATQLGDALFALSGKRLPAGVLEASLTNVMFTNDLHEQTFQVLGEWAYDVGYAKRPPTLDGLIARIER